jgi:RNA polymerase sigma-54 factor
MAGQPKMQQRLSQRQTQSLVMTQELQQAIKLLQMSNLELQAFIAAELEANPLLELAEPGAEDEQREARAETAGQAENTSQAETASGHETDLAEAFEDASSAEARMESMDMNPADVFSDDGPADAPELARAPEKPASAAGGMDWTQAGSGGSRRAKEAGSSPGTTRA